MTKMRAVQGISIPRSGHSAIFHILKAYFGDAFVYCDTNNPKHCGCGSVPCTNPRRTFAKNHDFGLREHHALLRLPVLRVFLNMLNNRGPFRLDSLPILPQERYLIQYRSPVRAITSNFKLYLKSNPKGNNRVDWEMFAKLDLAYWKRFVDKWVLDFPPGLARPLYCSYEDLVEHPESRIAEILAYFSDGELDEARLGAVLQRFPIGERNSLAEFEFYDPDFFREIERSTGGRMAKLQLPSFEEGF